MADLWLCNVESSEYGWPPQYATGAPARELKNGIAIPALALPLADIIRVHVDWPEYAVLA